MAAAHAQIEATCQECSATFIQKRCDQIFCCPKHKLAFHNRSMKRGKVLIPLMMCMTGDRRAASGTEAAERCAFARASVYALSDAWVKEDKKAGRPPMANIVQIKMDMAWSPCDLDVDF